MSIATSSPDCWGMVAVNVVSSTAPNESMSRSLAGPFLLSTFDVVELGVAGESICEESSSTVDELECVISSELDISIISNSISGLAESRPLCDCSAYTKASLKLLICLMGFEAVSRPHLRSELLLVHLIEVSCVRLAEGPARCEKYTEFGPTSTSYGLMPPVAT